MEKFIKLVIRIRDQCGVLARMVGLFRNGVNIKFATSPPQAAVQAAQNNQQQMEQLRQSHEHQPLQQPDFMHVFERHAPHAFEPPENGRCRDSPSR